MLCVTDDDKTNLLAAVRAKQAGAAMAIALVIASLNGIARADKTLNNITGAWVSEQKVRVEGGKIVEWRVMMRVTFVLND